MISSSQHPLIAGVAVVVSLLGAPPLSLGATPIAGGRYHGNTYEALGMHPTGGASLVVSRDGRTLTPGSDVSVWAPCVRQRRKEAGGARVRLTAPVPIRPDGSFRVVEGQGDTTLRMRGRFTQSRSIRLVARVRARPERPRTPRRPGFCIAGPSVLKLKLHSAPFRDCRTHPADTVAQSPEGRVFFQYWQSGPRLMKRAYGCLFSTNERVFIAAERGDSWPPERFQLSGPYVGYVVTVGCEGSPGCTFPSYFHIKDLRNGAKRQLPNLSAGVTDFLVSPSSAVAVIAPWGLNLPREVRIITGDSTQVIDSGEGIDPTSLELEGNVLSWIKDGTRRTALLE